MSAPGPDAEPQSPFADFLGIEAGELSPTRATARLAIRREHCNPTGAIHGGTMIGLADNLATRLANRANADGPNKGRFMVGIDLHATMLRNQQGGTITAEARVVRVGARVTVVRTVVAGDDGKALIEVTTTHIPA